MLFTAKRIDLSETQRIAKGTIRIVYEFPGQPDLLIKVFHDFERRSSRKRIKRLAWKLFPSLRYRSILSELKCEFFASLKMGQGIDALPLSRMLGIVQTDKGFGIVVERIAGLDGGLAPPLGHFLRNEAGRERVVEALNTLAKQLFELHIVARDINGSNIVYGTRGAGPACFLIDGYGERNLIPLRSLSKRLNDRSLDQQFASIAQAAGLVWDTQRRAFSITG